MVATSARLVRAARLDDVREAGCRVVHIEGRTVALFSHGDGIFAVENRCPHMGFPLHKGSVCDGILTCHWHHARFDLASGGTFDQWADDVTAFPVTVQDGEVWLDLAPGGDPRAHQRDRLRVGLERNLSLVIGKSVILLLDRGDAPVEPFAAPPAISASRFFANCPRILFDTSAMTPRPKLAARPESARSVST